MKRFSVLFIIFLIYGLKVEAWRSVLYPTNWYPGYTYGDNLYLHDFSYAGYKKGETNIPNVSWTIYDVTSYGADKTGGSDSTTSIQNAIDDAASNGSGIVYFPTGTYKVSLQSGKYYAIGITSSKIVLRGDGTNLTKIFCTNTTSMNGYKSVILISPDGSYGWNYWTPTTEVNPQSISVDIYRPTNVITVADASGFSVGDWIILKDDCDTDFDNDHYMGGEWDGNLRGVLFYRVITEINGNNITIDIPTRYKLLSRYQARVYKLPVSHISEIGIENLSIGMQETPGDQTDSIETSYTIDFRHVVNSWVRNVSSYCDTSLNPQGFHLRSNGIEIYQSRNITISNVVLKNAQYKGSSGSGYLFVLGGNDCLVENCKGISGRHNFDFKKMSSSGNVIYNCYTENGRYPSDFHMFLSMANLVDNMSVKDDYLQAVYRPYSTPEHGYTTTQSVFWNIIGISGTGDLIQCAQFSNGYVIGTSGTPNTVDSTSDSGTYPGLSPADFVEGVGNGNTLEPTSLYKDQLSRRLGLLNQITNYEVRISKIKNGVTYGGQNISKNPLPGYTIEYVVKSSNCKSNVNLYRVFNKIEGELKNGSLITAGLTNQYTTNNNPDYSYTSSDWSKTEPTDTVKYLGGKRTDFLSYAVAQYSYSFFLGFENAGSIIGNKAYGVINNFTSHTFESTIETITVGTMYGGRFNNINDIVCPGYSDTALFVDVILTNKGNVGSSFVLKVSNVNASKSISDWSSSIVGENDLNTISETPLLGINDKFNFRIKFTHNYNVTNGDWIEFRIIAQVKNNTSATSYIGDDGNEYGGDVGKDYKGNRGINPGYIFQQGNTNIRLTFEEKFLEKAFKFSAKDIIGNSLNIFEQGNSMVANYDVSIYVEFTNNNTSYTSVSILGLLNNYNNVRIEGKNIYGSVWKIPVYKYYNDEFDKRLLNNEYIDFPFKLYFNNTYISNWIDNIGNWSFKISEINNQENSITILENLIDSIEDEVKITYTVEAISEIEIKIYDINGVLVKTLFSDVQNRGKYLVKWNGIDESNSPVDNGLYFCVVRIGNIKEVRNIIIKR